MAKKPVIGLLGGGQLGRMLCEAAGPRGIEIAVLDEDLAPAKHAANLNGLHIAGSFKDAAKIRDLAAHCDVLTVEIEHVDTEVLEDIETNGVQVQRPDGTTYAKKVPVHPSWKTLRLIQDKFLQKEHFRSNGLPTAEQRDIEAGGSMRSSLQQAAQEFGFPFMLKARKGSYDGRGNYKVTSDEVFAHAMKELAGLSLYAEKWVPFEMELAVMVIRTEDPSGKLKDVSAYPAVETVHVDSICQNVFMPPRNVSEEVCERAKKLACEVVSTLWGRGVFAVEMFLLKDGSLRINECAPRPHNSGHYTMEAVPYLSQYHAQLLSVLDMPMKKPIPRVKSAMMINILGGMHPGSHDKLVDMAESNTEDDYDIYVHLYGKASKPSRKIGHITITTELPIASLEKFSHPLVAQVEEIRQDRIQAASASLRPTEVAAPTEPVTARGSALVLVTMGSDSDLPVLKAGLDILKEVGVPFEVHITSAHRTPDLMGEVAANAAGRGIKVIIGAAGGAAHLPGMFASHTSLPVIGVPVKATHLDGQDSLLSIVQMPRGVPVATVGINNSTNAALLAIRILGSYDADLQKWMDRYRLRMQTDVEAKYKKLQEIGYEAYLKHQGK